MPGSTVPLGFPYPLPADPANGPQAIQDLAEAVDLVAQSTLDSVSTVVPASVKVNGGTMNTSTGVPVNQTFTSPAVFDNRGFFDVIADSQGLLVVEAGWYVVTANLTWAPNTAGARTIAILENAATVSVIRTPPSPTAGFGTVQNIIALRNFAASSKIRLQLFQTSGGALQALSSNLSAYRVR